jgi:hypothetical protein
MAVLTEEVPEPDAGSQERAPLAPNENEEPDSEECAGGDTDEYQPITPAEDGADAPLRGPTRRRYGVAVGLVGLLVGAAVVAVWATYEPRTIILPTAASSYYSSSSAHSSCSWNNKDIHDGDGQAWSCEMTDNHERMTARYRSVNNDRVIVYMGWADTMDSCGLRHESDIRNHWAAGWVSYDSHDNLHHEHSKYLTNNEYRADQACINFVCNNWYGDCQIEVGLRLRSRDWARPRAHRSLPAAACSPDLHLRELTPIYLVCQTQVDHIGIY